MWRILIADDQEGIRVLVRGILECQEGSEVCGEASDGKQAIEMVKNLRLDLIVLSLHIPNANGANPSGPDMNGFGTVRSIARNWPKIRILVLSADESVHFARAAEECGAHGFLSKAQATAHLAEAVEALQRNEGYFPTFPRKEPVHFE